MRYPPIPEMSLVGVFSPGIQGQERIALRTSSPINLSQIGILLGHRNDKDVVTPIPDNFFLFPEFDLPSPSWLFLYTGKGAGMDFIIPESGQRAYIYYWGKERTIFDAPGIVPIVFSIDRILIGKPCVIAITERDMREAMLSMPKMRKSNTDNDYVLAYRNLINAGIYSKSQLDSLINSSEIMEWLSRVYVEELKRPSDAPLDPVCVGTWGAMMTNYGNTETVRNAILERIRNSNECKALHEA